MLDCLFSLKPDAWTAIFTGLTALIIFISAIIAIINLRIIAKTQHLNSIREFLKDLSDTSEERRFIFQEFNLPTDKSPMPYEIEKKVQNVLNSLNRIGLLLENNLLSTKLVLSISHTMVIRCWFKLSTYIDYHENLIGGRYGRRIERIAAKAKNYHDAHLKHRFTVIKIDPGNNKLPYEVYKTNIKRSFGGIIQKLCWCFRRSFNIY